MSSFDGLLLTLGGFGKYQRIQYFLLCVPAGILAAMHQLASVFLTATPEHRCELPHTDLFNGTDTWAIQSQAHNASILQYIPLKSTDRNNRDDRCGLIDNSSIIQCDSWVYSQEDFQRTVITQWDMVCAKEWNGTTLSAMVYMAGVLIGAFVFGILSDAIGRKKTLLIVIFLQGSAGLATGFAPEFYSFIIFRFLVGAASMGLFMTAFVLGIELIGPQYRLFAGIVIEYFFALGYVLLTGVAYGYKDWKYMQITISAPSFLFLAYYWLVPESARWLLAKGRIQEAEVIVQQAAKTNGVTLPDKVFESLEENPVPQEKIGAICSATTLLRRTLIIFFNWFVVAMGYYGLSLNSGSLGGNIYINFMVGGLVEFPAYTICFLCNKLGRKGPHVFGMLLAGLACLGTVFVDLYMDKKTTSPATLNIWFVTLNMVGKFGMTMGFCIIYFWSAEIYPTQLRNSLMGFSSTLARVGSICAPFIANIGQIVPKRFERVLPAAIFGSLVIIGGLLSILLPETTGHELPETVEEANAFPHHRDLHSKYEEGKEVETKFD